VSRVTAADVARVASAELVLERSVILVRAPQAALDALRRDGWPVAPLDDSGR